MSARDKIGEVLLYIARHAEVEKDKEGRIRGLINDSLDDKGEKQAEELAEFFANKPLSAVHTDDLDRTYQTALPVARDKGLTIMCDVDLRSWDPGPELEGMSIEANKEEVKKFKMQPKLVPVGGQSWGDYEKQIIHAVARHLEFALDAAYPALLIMHGSGIAILAEHFGAQELGHEYDDVFLEPAGIAAIYGTRKGFMMKALKGAIAGVEA